MFVCCCDANVVVQCGFFPLPLAVAVAVALLLHCCFCCFCCSCDCQVQWVAVGANHNIALTNTNEMFSWGSNRCGALGRPNSLGTCCLVAIVMVFVQ